jgi:5-methylcytosine-specific restriction enzyme subunit McrC
MTRARVELGEYQRVALDVPPPSPADEQLAQRLASPGDDVGRLEVKWLANGKAEITANSWVGVVRFSHLDVHVVPKLVGGNLQVLRMLDYALGVGMLRRLPVDRPLAAEGQDLFDLVCLLLTEEARAIVRDGLLRDYRSVDDTVQVLRGRLRHREQFLTRYGRLDQLECRFDEYDANTPENQLLAAALAVARRRSDDRDVRVAALRLAAIYDEACQPPTANADWYEQAITYNRRNARYRAAHELAKLVLRATAFHDLYDTTGPDVGAFLIDMNRVFERFVIRLIDEALADSPDEVVVAHQRFRAVVRDEDTGRTYSAIDPDLIIKQSVSGGITPIDAKYKLYERRKLSASDIYQTFLYAYALGHGDPPRAGIVFPATADLVGPALSVKPLTGPTAARITGIGLDIPFALAALEDGRRSTLLAKVREAVRTCTGDRVPWSGGV